MLNAATLVLISVLTTGAGDQAPPVGKRVSDFELSDHLGAKHALAEWSDKRAVVAVFLGTECPLSKLYGQRLVELAEHYRGKPVQFVAINSNRQDSLADIAQFARVHKI